MFKAFQLLFLQIIGFFFAAQRSSTLGMPTFSTPMAAVTVGVIVFFISIYSTIDASYCIVAGAGSDVNGYYSGLESLFIRRESVTSGALPDFFMLQQWKPNLKRYDGPVLGRDKGFWSIHMMRTAMYQIADLSNNDMPTSLYGKPWSTLSSAVDPPPHIVQCSGFIDYNPALPVNPKTNYEIMTAQPVTMVVLFIILGYGYYLWNFRIDVDTVSCSYQKVITEKQYYRIFTSSFAHVDLMHIGFNLMTLYQFGSLEAFVVGSFDYAVNSLNLIIWTILLLLTIQFAYAKFTNDLTILTHSGIGYSCVLFAWMVVVSVKMEKFCPVFFLPDFCFTTMHIANRQYFPVNFGPVVLLIATKFVLPRSSFIGHLSGILLGFPLAWNCFDGFSSQMLLASIVVAIIWVERLYAYPISGSNSIGTSGGTTSEAVTSFVSGLMDAVSALLGDPCGALASTHPLKIDATASTRHQVRQLLAIALSVHDAEQPISGAESQRETSRSLVNCINRNRLATLKLYSNCCIVLKIVFWVMMCVTLVLACIVWIGIVNGLIRLGVLCLLLTCYYLFDLYGQRYYLQRVQPQLMRAGHLTRSGTVYNADTEDSTLLEAREYQLCQLLLILLGMNVCMFLYDCANTGSLLSSYQLLHSNDSYQGTGSKSVTMISYNARLAVGLSCYALLAVLELLLVGLSAVCLKGVCANDTQDAEYNPNVLHVRGVLGWLRLLDDAVLAKLEAVVNQLILLPGCCSFCCSAPSGVAVVVSDNLGSYEQLQTGDDGVEELEMRDDLEMSSHTSYRIQESSVSVTPLGAVVGAPAANGRISASNAARNAALKRYENK